MYWLSRMQSSSRIWRGLMHRVSRIFCRTMESIIFELRLSISSSFHMVLDCIVMSHNEIFLIYISE